ncbi:Hypothetical predicted protein [Paramuricea clavata]|uniref:Uncharacterized protein n=1 Tax=Paramuricea clavata TaxID=317549 RepID=A0A7D9I4R0_PARCT|nr:Hypothetical predicted protein [Paramuricea clavata]
MKNYLDSNGKQPEERLSWNTPSRSRLKKRKRSDDEIARKGYNSNNTAEDKERIHLESEPEVNKSL